MPIISTRVSVAAGATNANIFSGEQFEFLQEDSVLSVGVVTEGAAGEVTARVKIGDAVVADPYQVPSMANQIVAAGAGAAGRGVLPEDMRIPAAGKAGDRITMSVTNTGAGANVVEALVFIG